MHKKLIRWLPAALILAAGGSIFEYSQVQSRVLADGDVRARPAARSDKLKFPPNAAQLSYVKVQFATVQPEPLTPPLNGHVVYDGNRTAPVSSPLAGRVVRILAEPGDRVVAGQPLLLLDSPDFGNAVADVAKADATVSQKKQAYERAKLLFGGNVLAKKDLESAEADYRQAAAEGERARLRLRGLGFASAPSGSEFFTLRAPIGGIVADRQVNPGAEVRPDAPNPLFVITDPTHLWITMEVAEADIAKIRIGQFVQAEVDAYPGMHFDAKVASIGAAVDPVSRRIPVRCILVNPDGRLKAEMYARVVPVDSTGRKSVRLPATALVSEGVHTFIFVETKSGEYEKRRVEIALQGPQEAYLKSGISANERVVVSGAALLNSELTGG